MVHRVVVRVVLPPSLLMTALEMGRLIWRQPVRMADVAMLVLPRLRYLGDVPDLPALMFPVAMPQLCHLVNRQRQIPAMSMMDKMSQLVHNVLVLRRHQQRLRRRSQLPRARPPSYAMHLQRQLGVATIARNGSMMRPRCTRVGATKLR